MESLFENTFVRTPGLMAEFHKASIFNVRSMILPAVLSAVMIVNALALIRSAAVTVTVFLFLLVIWGLSFVSMYRRYKAAVRRDEEVSKVMTEQRVSVYENKLRLDTGARALEIEYGKVKYAMVTEHLIAVVSDAKLAYIMAKDGFTKGDADGLIAFLKENGIKVRR